MLLEAPLITTLDSSGDSFLAVLRFLRGFLFWVSLKIFLGLLFIYLSLLGIPLSTSLHISLVFILIFCVVSLKFFWG